MSILNVIVMYVLVVVAIGAASTAHEPLPFLSRVNKGVGLLVWFFAAGFVVSLVQMFIDTTFGLNIRASLPILYSGVNLILAAIGGWIMFKKYVYKGAVFPPKLHI